MHGADSSNKRGWAALAVVAALALSVRLLPWPAVFAPDGVRLMADGDTYYHALRAERLARDWPHVPWFDRGMNFPDGAAVPWPPLLDQIVAGLALATGIPTPEHVAAVAAVVPVLAGVLLVLATAALAGILLGGAPWWEAALLVALLPAAVRQSFVGRPDHHVLEALLSALAYVAYLAAARGGRRRLVWTLGLGATLALGFWNWSGSALYLLVLALHVGSLHLALPPGDPAPGRAAGTLAAGAGVAAALLAVAVWIGGPPGALGSGSLTPITGLAVALCAATDVGAGVLWVARRRWPSARLPGRLTALTMAAAAPALLVVVLPGTMLRGVAHGLEALGAGSAWYASIGEFWPLFGSGRQPLAWEFLLAAVAYGFTPLVIPAAVALVVRRWRSEVARRPELLFLVAWSFATFAIALARRRFEGYAVVPLAILAGWCVREGVAATCRRWPRVSRWTPLGAVATILLLALPGLPVVATGAVAELPAQAEDRFPLYRLLRTLPAHQGREGVLASWSDGHEIQWLARKPVVSTPFGTDIAPASLADEAAFMLEEDPGAAEALLRRRRIGWVFVQNPSRAVATLRPFAPGKPERAVLEESAEHGARYAFHPEFFDLVASRLWFFDGGSASGNASGLAGFRLLAESQTPNQVLGHVAQAHKLFGVVEGATLVVHGAPPGAEVAAAVPLRSNVGRDFLWAGRVAAGTDGTARLRVPYARGSNGAVAAGPYVILVGGERRGETTVDEGAVLDGREVEVPLAPRARAR